MKFLVPKRTLNARPAGAELIGAGRLIMLLVACVISPSVASASCVWSDLIQVEARAATVTSTSPRVHFVEDDVLMAGCPNASAACQMRAYVVPGDVVLTGPTQGAFTCAGFQGPRGGGRIDWLPTASLTFPSASAQNPADWAGQWSAPEQDITIRSEAGGILAVDGEATWGMGDPARVQNGGVHIGALSGKARPVAGVLSFTQGDDRTLTYAQGDEYSCRARMFRRGPFLLVRDNNNCGGANVSFSGFYTRKK